jgi:hypothetical protein
MIISFGVFQTYYVSTLHQTRSDIAWVGSIAVFLLFFMGIVSGRLTDAGYFRITTIVGAVLVVLGTFTTSLAKTYWQIILAQGVCTGLGNGFLLTPMMTLVTTYFKRRLPLVMGIAACGSVTGGLIYPSMVRTLLPTIGFGWTLRAIGFIQLGTFAIALVCSRPKEPLGRSGPILDWTVFKEPPFTLYLIGSFLVSIGCLILPFPILGHSAHETKGFYRRLFPFFLLKLLCAGEAGNVIHSIAQPHAHSERHRICSTFATQCHCPVCRHVECVHSILVCLCTVHVYLDTSTLNTRAICVDNFLQSVSRRSSVTFPCCGSSHNFGYVKDWSAAGNCFRSRWSWRIAWISSLWYNYRLKCGLVCWCPSLLRVYIGFGRLYCTCCAGG